MIGLGSADTAESQVSSDSESESESETDWAAAEADQHRPLISMLSYHIYDIIVLLYDNYHIIAMKAAAAGEIMAVYEPVNMLETWSLYPTKARWIHVGSIFTSFSSNKIIIRTEITY